MNFIRKFCGARRTVEAESAAAMEVTRSASHLYLNKLFEVYKLPPQFFTDAENDDKRYNYLPMFCKEFGTSPSSEMKQKFWDINTFCQQVSKLMVSEIRKLRTSNEGMEAESFALAKYLEIENSEESKYGWKLLSTLHILADGDKSLIQVMATAGIPSALVECLYLFCHLPEIPEAEDDHQDDISDSTPRKGRILLQKTLVEVLVNLSSHPFPCEELARKGDLGLLFSTITTRCAPHNIMWRKSAGEVLITLSRRGLTPSVVQYIHNKKCMALCIDNMQKIREFTPLETIEMFLAVFCFLKESSKVTQLFLDDFRSCQGYLFLSEFLLKLEEERVCGPEVRAALHNLVLKISSLCTFFVPLPVNDQPLADRPINCESLNPAGKQRLRRTKTLKPIELVVGERVIGDQSTVPRSSTETCQWLSFDLIQPTTPRRAVRNVQAFQVLQSVFTKSNSATLSCTILDVISKVCHANNTYYFILENQKTLSRFTEEIHTKNIEIQDKFFELLKVVVFQLNLVPWKELKSLSLLMETNKSRRCSILCIKTLLIILYHNEIFKDVYRDVDIVRELIVTDSEEEDMSALLRVMHAAPNDALRLKLHILKALMACLKDSHRIRTIFREVDGFVYVTGVFRSLEGNLNSNELMNRDMLQLVQAVFHTISTAMRFEPTNAKYFHDEICMTTLTDTIRRLGCFTEETELLYDEEAGDIRLYEVFREVFTGSIMDMSFPDTVPVVFIHASIVSRMLYDVALEAFEKPSFSGTLDVNSPGLTRSSSPVNVSTTAGRTASLNLSTGSSLGEALVVHPGVVVVLAKLLPALPRPSGHEAHARALRDYLAHVLKSLVDSARNQQVMCDAGLTGVMLRVYGATLLAEHHALHEFAVYMLEKLAAYALRPSDLRELLRLGNPLYCVAPEPGQVCKPGGPVPLATIKMLVSMTTPGDDRLHNFYSLPPFVEFDMSVEGFGCIYLPVITPQSADANTLGNQYNATIGGIASGNDDRVFPPETGLTYSTWICVEKYSDPSSDPHCVRLLTLVRNINNSQDDHRVCLAVALSARNKAIIVSTKETTMPQNDEEWEPEGSGVSGARVCDLGLQEGQWHQLVLVFKRAVLKDSTFSLYLDGQHKHTSELLYVSASFLESSVYCVVGTPPQWRRHSRLVWRQGPAMLLEEVIQAQTVSIIYQLGPHCNGTLQSRLPSARTQEQPAPVVAEEKVVFSISARDMAQLTLAKIRIHNENYAKSIAKLLGMSFPNDNATLIRILYNCSSGPASAIAGVVVGYLGVRTFHPKPVAIMIDTVGGCSVLLGLIAMAQDVECLSASVEALVCVVRSNKAARAEIDCRKGYQTLAMLLKRKKELLNSHILHLIFDFVGTVDRQNQISSIPNIAAFQDLICDLDVWLGAPDGLIKSLLKHLLELATKKHNLRIMRELRLVPKLLYIINDVKVVSTENVLLQLLAALLGVQPRPNDLLCLGQFMLYTLPLPSETEIGLILTNDEQVILRNKCFNVLHDLLFTARNLLNKTVCEDISRVLGMNWLLSFMQENVHPTTFVWALRILVIICSGQEQQSAIMRRFRTDVHNGGRLPTEAVQFLHSRVHSEQLRWLVLSHYRVPELYYLLFGLMLGQPMRNVSSKEVLSIESVWAAAFGTDAPTRQPCNDVVARVILFPEAMIFLLEAVKLLIHMKSTNLPDWLKEYPVAIIQVMSFLYNTLPNFAKLMMAAEALRVLTWTLFPPLTADDINTQEDAEPVPGGAPTPDAALPQHAARPHVIDFLKVIVLHSLSLNVSGKTVPVIDLVLDAFPPDSTGHQQIEYQTEVLTVIMESLSNTELFSAECNECHILNVCYLTARLVSKLWQGRFYRDPREVFDFIMKLLTQANANESYVNSLKKLRHCLNRTILFLLSRSTDNIADKTVVSETMNNLTTNRLLISMVFGAGNLKLKFIGCLTYCLLQLNANMRIPIDSGNDIESRDDTGHVLTLNTHRGRNTMADTSTLVWEELYACKKPAIEKVFKVTLVLPEGNARAPDLTAVREQLGRSAHKLWIKYIDKERKVVEFHNQNQSKIRKMTGGLSRRRAEMDESARQPARLRRRKALVLLLNYVQLQRQAWCVQLQTAATTCTNTTRYVQFEWARAWYELTRESGLWGPPGASPLHKWALDPTEGPCRMRKRLRRNHLFYLHYPYRPELDNPNIKLDSKVPQSLDSKEYYRVYQQWRTAGDMLGDIDGIELTDLPTYVKEVTNNRDQSHDDSNENGSPSDLVSRGVVHSGTSQTTAEGNTHGPVKEADYTQQSIRRNWTHLGWVSCHEKFTHKFRCARIEALDAVEGLLLFGKDHCYVIDGFTLLNNEIQDLDSCPDDYEPILPSKVIQRSDQRQCIKILYKDIREVLTRRYLLLPIALEVFSRGGRSYLLAFTREQRSKVYSRFKALAQCSANSAVSSVAGQKRGSAVEAPGLLATLVLASVTQRWLRGETSNFQYLMHLNTLAGRSYNDLMQYPVFPWILADYDSLELDLNEPATFRDLTKPMGAQYPGRLQEYRLKYKALEESCVEPPRYYDTHYSSAMAVCFFLLRMEPFTQYFVKLQGKLDLADREFHSVKEAWESASKNHITNVKELVPEFFYMPEFLLNSNNFDLGTRQNGVVLGDVVLPPWARGDPREFIRVHRAALESDYVSHRLHHWIDLVFGYKQQGQPAIDADNVFYHLFYEGAVDINNIDDPVKKEATIGSITNIGQIPKQLFKKPHPMKKMSQRNSSQGITPPEKLFFHNLEDLRPSLQPVKEVEGPVGQILYTDKTIMAVEQNRVLMPPAYDKFVEWGFADHSLRVRKCGDGKTVLICEKVAPSSGGILTCVCPSADTIVTAGTSTVVTVWQYLERRRRLTVRACLYGHLAAVTCLAASPAHSLVVSGSRDGRAILWDVERARLVRLLVLPAPAPLSALAINDLTGDIVTCSGGYLYAWDINGRALGAADTGGAQVLCCAFSETREWDPLNVIITGSADGVVAMWSLDYVSETVEDQGSGEAINADQPEQPATSTNEEDEQLKWRRRLVLRGKLTMPAAHAREHACAGAGAVTALAAARSGCELAAGDASGRIFCWSVPGTADAAKSGPADNLVRDDTTVPMTGS